MWNPIPRTLRAAAVLAAVLALATAAGCGGDPDQDGGRQGGSTPGPTATGPGTPQPSPTGSPAPDVQLLEFDISGGVADPPLDRVTVDRGTTVRIVVTSDEPDEIHLHGYDHQAEIGPGREGVIEFVANQDGLFDLETHHSGLTLLQLAVR